MLTNTMSSECKILIVEDEPLIAKIDAFNFTLDNIKDIDFS